MRTLTILAALLWGAAAYGQDIPLPADMPQGHPRLLVSDGQKPVLQNTIRSEPWAGEVMEGIVARIDPYLEHTRTQADWLSSRLMMYWKSHATQVYIDGGVYSHAEGEAPCPTPRFGSTRGVGSPFKRPDLEDIVPYMDDTKGVCFRNTAREGAPLEWTDAANVSGGSIESVNEQIMSLAKDAAFLYWITGDEQYARLAFGPFDTYLTGMYYRTEPIDEGHGHAQTLVGMSTFEVIQERILNELAYTYDFLHGYIAKNHPEKIDIYAAALKKWIDVSIRNGVPHNNWNLHKSKFILRVAMVLEDDTHYADGRGRQYYLNTVLNSTSARHWSLPRFLAYGYDPATGIWNECPGYAQGVTRDLGNFIRDYDNTFDQNLLPYAPVMKKAVAVLPQYLFPNGQITAFGDSHYGGVNTEAFADMIRLAQKYDNREDEKLFTAMYRLFDPQAAEKTGDSPERMPAQVASFFTTKPLVLDPTIEAGELGDYVTPAFYAPNVSWLVQRNGYDDPQNGLMISQYASLGNHAHSNGIAMELYGKGYVLGAESGIGSTYFEKPYLEYYSQFPAHNTVMVDGVSKYPEMLSNHPFDRLAGYPESGQTKGFYPGATYSEVHFVEPESRSDQRRTMGIVSTGEGTGYYVDIFRSARQRGGDRFHDYFYHNLGQELSIEDAGGRPLALVPSEEMAFAGGHLFALDYMWDKRSARTDGDYRAVWKMSFADGNHVCMNLWMKGYPGREVFSIKAPPVKSFRGDHGLPYAVDREPYLTIAARQHGEAWEAPFVSIFEPTTQRRGSSIASIASFDAAGSQAGFVGLTVTGRSGRVDRIFSSDREQDISADGVTVNASYAIVSEQGADFTLFLGNGRSLSARGFTLTAAERTNAVLECRDGQYFFTAEAPMSIRTPDGRQIEMDRTDYKKITL